MTKNNLTYADEDRVINLDLPKWPALVVSGKRITEDQAAEVIIKTDYFLPSFKYSANDRDFTSVLNALFGIPYEDEDYKRTQNLRVYLGNLGLEYLATHRIVSSWIGGPHGWCDWSGNIFSNNYNIGKWPSIQYVANEWAVIAENFPFLDLKSQLFSGETSEDNAVPIIQFNVKDGSVVVLEPEDALAPPVCDLNAAVMGILSNPMRERGITIGLLEEKLKNLYDGEIPQY